MTLDEAWKIVGKFGALLADKVLKYREFESKLPYPKDQILLAFLKIIEEEDFKSRAPQHGKSEQELRQLLSVGLLSLFQNFLPDREEYERQLREMERVNDFVEPGRKTGSK